MNGNKIIEFPGLNTSHSSEEERAENLAAIRASDRTSLDSARWDNRVSTGRVRFSPSPDASTLARTSPSADRLQDAEGFLKLLSEISG